MSSVSTIIVNFRTPELTIAAAQSVLAEPETLEVVIVENGSGGNDLDVLRSAFTGVTKVKIVPSESNLGFGGGNNLGVREASGSLVFLLNSDATLNPGGLVPLVLALEANPAVGVVAPKVYVGDGKTLQGDAYGEFPTPGRILSRSTKSPPETLTPEWLTACAILLRKADFESVGGFDPSLFMYMEDVLLCWNLARQGKTCLRVLESSVVHLGGASSKSTPQKKKMYYASQEVYLRKTGAGWAARLVIRMLRWPNYVLGRLLGR